ncbi:hypothetical protein [Streptomyces sp. NPDC029674]|uniref:hypothetical protein n=1 Tax=Streptomyces sp. NPDC029674 TaxID=3365297 RepID=UPI00384CD470
MNRSGMKSQVNIIAVVDVIGALSIKSLYDGNLCMVDDSAFDSTHQGTPNLVTVVKPGQVVSWTALAVDLQTPVEIKSISFAPVEGRQGQPGQQGQQGLPGYQGQSGQQGYAAGQQGHDTRVGVGTATPSAPGMGTAVPAPGPGATGTQAAPQAQQPHQTPQAQAHQTPQPHQAHGSQEQDGDKLDLDVWTGVVPHWMTPGVPYQYRLELQMYEGANSVMTIDSPALMCQ